MALIELDECLFDMSQLARSHGYEALDPIGREAFVNHIHITGDNRTIVADRVIADWTREMETNWPGHTFRIYRVEEPAEVTVRSHAVREGMHNWCESYKEGVEVITIGPTATPP